MVWGSGTCTTAIGSTPQDIFELHREDRPVAADITEVEPQNLVEDKLVIYGNLVNTPLIGYLARPVEINASVPAIIVIHEWWGLNDNIKSMARRLAGEGYLVLAVDLYGGRVATTPKRARELVTAALENSSLLANNLKQAYRYLEVQHRVPKIASLGWCFGGTWSLNTALLFPEQLDAAVIYYGSGITSDRIALSSLQMPLLGIFGELDTRPSVETVRQFQSVLDDLGKSAEIYIYEGADHAFANPSGNRYNAQAAEDAWEKTLSFFKKHLQD